MDWVLNFEAIGSFCMGIFIAWVAFFFLNREKTFTGAEFGQFVAVMLGGTIIQVFTSFTNILSAANAWIFWFYPIGLLVGMLAYKYIGKGIITLKMGVGPVP